MTFLKWAGIRGLVKKNDWPKYTEEEPEIYEREELRTLSGLSAEERVVRVLSYDRHARAGSDVHLLADINSHAGTVRVSHKPDRNWSPKAYKEREIPVPEDWSTALKAAKAS